MVKEIEQPTLLVYFDVASNKLSWKIKNKKGSRWKNGYKVIDDVVTDADKEIKAPYWIDYVGEKL